MELLPPWTDVCSVIPSTPRFCSNARLGCAWLFSSRGSSSQSGDGLGCSPVADEDVLKGLVGLSGPRPPPYPAPQAVPAVIKPLPRSV